MELAGRSTQGRRLITPGGGRHLDVTHGIRRMDTLFLQSHDLCRLSPCGRHTAFVAAFCLGFGDPLPLAFVARLEAKKVSFRVLSMSGAQALDTEHGLPFCLAHSTDDSQHQPAGRCAASR